MTKVINAIGTSGETCSCPNGDGTWLEHWKLNINWNGGVLYCAAHDCLSRAEVGAHVQKVIGPDMATYIVPFCQSCNHRNDIITVPDEFLVPARCKDFESSVMTLLAGIGISDPSKKKMR